MKSFLIVIVGLVLIFKGIPENMSVSDSFFVLLLAVLAAFFALLGGCVLLMRMNNLRFRRKFVFSFFAVTNICISGAGLLFGLLHKIETSIDVTIYIVSFLVGATILADILFGKRRQRNQETEMLIE